MASAIAQICPGWNHDGTAVPKCYSSGIPRSKCRICRYFVQMTPKWLAIGQIYPERSKEWKRPHCPEKPGSHGDAVMCDHVRQSTLVTKSPGHLSRSTGNDIVTAHMGLGGSTFAKKSGVRRKEKNVRRKCWCFKCGDHRKKRGL